MSIDQPQRNKMIETPVAKKGFHFASDGIHFAEFIEAATIEEATAIYHNVKRDMSPAATSIETPVAPPSSKEQSTPLPEEEEQNNS
jgi:hypothetical protein